MFQGPKSRQTDYKSPQCQLFTKQICIFQKKLDSPFPHAQSSIKECSKPYISDRYRNGGGVIIVIREGFLSKLLSSKFNLGNKEQFLVEINLCKKKWLKSLSITHTKQLYLAILKIKRKKQIHSCHNRKHYTSRRL